MCLRVTFATSLLLVLGFAGRSSSPLQSTPSHPTQKPRPAATTEPSSRLAQLLTGLEQGDFRKVFDSAFVYQAKIAEIKAQNPQAMWKRLTTEYYDSARAAFIKPPPPLTGWFAFAADALPSGALGSAFFARSSAKLESPSTSFLRGLMKARPSWKIAETRRLQEKDQSGTTRDFTLSYVQLKYREPAAAPVVSRGLLKEAIVGVKTVRESGLFWSAELVPKSDSFWELEKPRLAVTQWTMGSGWPPLYFSYNVLGGRPPYSSLTYCDGHALEKLPGASATTTAALEAARASVYGSPLTGGYGGGMSHRSHIIVRIEHKAFPNVSYPLKCTVTIRDSSGLADSAAFLVPREHNTESGEWFCWIRQPWLEQPELIQELTDNARRDNFAGGCTEVAQLSEASAADLGSLKETAPTSAGAAVSPEAVAATSTSSSRATTQPLPALPPCPKRFTSEGSIASPDRYRVWTVLPTSDTSAVLTQTVGALETNGWRILRTDAAAGIAEAVNAKIGQGMVMVNTGLAPDGTTRVEAVFNVSRGRTASTSRVRKELCLLVDGMAAPPGKLDGTVAPPTREFPGECPGEGGCQFGTWTSKVAVKVYEGRSDRSPIAFQVEKGEKVTGIASVLVVERPGSCTARERANFFSKSDPRREIKIPAGKQVKSLYFQGEGLIWGEYEGAEGSACCEGDSLDCSGEYKSTLWLQVKSRSGRVGWTDRRVDFVGTSQYD